MMEPMGVTIIVFDWVGKNLSSVCRVYGGESFLVCCNGGLLWRMAAWSISAQGVAGVRLGYENTTINKHRGSREFTGALYCRGGGKVGRKLWDSWLEYVVGYGGVVRFYRKSGTRWNYRIALV